MPLRTLFFWFHLTAGLLAGSVIFVMSATGVLLAFERQALELAERDLLATPDEARGTPLPISTLVAAAVATAPDAPPSVITVRADRRAPLVVGFGRDRMRFVHRYNGRVLGDGASRLRRFFHANEELHRELAMGPVGKKVAAGANLIFLVLVLSGAWLWIPKRPTRTAFLGVMLFRRGLRGRARDFNWHNVLGIWAFVPLVAIVVSGVVISYPWATALVYRAFGSKPPAQRTERPATTPSKVADADRGRTAERAAQLDRAWDSALVSAASVAPKWRSLSMRQSQPDASSISFSMDEGNGGRPDRRSQLLIDPSSGSLREHKTYAKQSAGQKARSWLRWIHTGEAGGILGQVVAALASTAALLMVWTGIALALRRFARWRRGTAEIETNAGGTALEEAEA